MSNGGEEFATAEPIFFFVDDINDIVENEECIIDTIVEETPINTRTERRMINNPDTLFQQRLDHLEAEIKRIDIEVGGLFNLVGVISDMVTITKKAEEKKVSKKKKTNEPGRPNRTETKISLQKPSIVTIAAKKKPKKKKPAAVKKATKKSMPKKKK